MSSPHTLTKERFIHDLKTLVGFETISGQQKGFAEALQFIQEQIDPKATIKILEVEDKSKEVEPGSTVKMLLASNRDTKTPDICYLVHLDVVPAQPHQFQMTIEGDRAYGRGVSDMKYSIPLGYSLLNDLIRDNSEMSFMVVITTDEERGGFSGSGYLADEYGLNPKLLIVPDGGNDFTLVNKSKGVCQLRVTRDGKPAHGSVPWKGENALAPVVKLASQLLDEYQENNTGKEWATTMNLGKIHGGNKVNQVAPHAEMELDFRFPPEKDSVKSITDFIEEKVTEIDPKLIVEVIATGVATLVDPELPPVQLFMQCIEDKIGRKMKIEGEEGSNDARHFNKNGTPFLMTKPEGGDIHGDHEYLDIPATLLYYEALYLFLKRYEQELLK